MALEERSGNYYYYRKEREGKRVVSKYYGKGELADLVYRMDEIERIRKAHKLELEREDKKNQDKTDDQLSTLEKHVRLLISEFLTGKGFYQTSSREWRVKNNERE